MPEFYHSSNETQKHGEKLPHWQQNEVIQFVTFRLADSLPKTKLRQWQEELAAWEIHHPKPWSHETNREYHQRFTAKLETWLDQGSGSCLLKNYSSRLIVQEILMHDQGTKADHHAWVIMPNHVHLLFTPLFPLEKLLQVWKGISSRRLGEGKIWQKNYRDTMIRNQDHFANTVRYIRRNPAKLPPDTFTLWQSDRALAIK